MHTGDFNYTSLLSCVLLNTETSECQQFVDGDRHGVAQSKHLDALKKTNFFCSINQYSQAQSLGALQLELSLEGKNCRRIHHTLLWKRINT